MKSILNISGIKCDYCKYKNSNVHMNDYDKWLNKPCPTCSNNLLTQLDYEMVKQLVSLIGIQNSDITVNNADEPMITVTFDMNGSGNLTIKNIVPYLK